MRVRISIPAFGAMVSAHTMRSVMNLTHAFVERGIDWALDFIVHESLIPRARNLLVMDLLEDPAATHNMWIDADIKFRAEDVLAMLDADRELVVGAYPAKSFDLEELAFAAKNDHPDPLRYATRMVVNTMPGDYTVDGGCVPITEGATGFMLCKRAVYEKIIDKYPNDYYLSDDPKTRGRKIWEIFACPNVGHRLLSEDYFLCRRAARCGIQTWLYLPAQLGHVGQHIYTGDVFKQFVPNAVQEAAE